MRIKLLTITISLLLLGLSSSGFRTITFCDVFGHVIYGSFVRLDGCQMISVRKESNDLVMYDDTHWVRVVIPDDTKDGTPFRYHWGGQQAHFSSVSVFVDWGFILRG